MTVGPWRLLADCPHCRTASAVVETCDPQHPAWLYGLPVERRCRACGWEQHAPQLDLALGPDALPRCPVCLAGLSPTPPCPSCAFDPTPVTTLEPTSMRDEAASMARLRLWAEEESATDVDAFVDGTFGMTVALVLGRWARGEPVDTSLDAVAWLFPTEEVSVTSEVNRTPTPVPVRRLDAAPIEDNRAGVRMLVSVMLADGVLRAGERTFIDRWLIRERLAPLVADELRVWAPHEAGRSPSDPDRWMEAAVHMMHLDRLRDDNEWRVILAFARAWAVEEEKIMAWDKEWDRRNTSAMGRLVRLLSGLVLGR